MEKLAIVVPCYNEEEVLKIASEALRGVLDDLIHKGKIAEDSFILFVNDGSKDRTWELIEEEHQAHPVQVCGVKLAGNVGHQFALTAGLITAMDLSDVTVSIDADLQDDVAVIGCDKFYQRSAYLYPHIDRTGSYRDFQSSQDRRESAVGRGCSTGCFGAM